MRTPRTLRCFRLYDPIKGLYVSTIMKNEIILFETEDRSITLPVQVTADTVWLNRNQLAELFGRDIKTIGKHIGNALKEELEESEVVAKFATTTRHGAIEGKTQTHLTEYYNLDMIISVGYRVKSKRGVEFRRWANKVLKQYIMQGYAVNQKRLNDLGRVVKLLKRTENSLDAKQVLTVVERYSTALDLLDSYDHQTLQRPKGNSATYLLTYEECRQVIDSMSFGEASDLFGLEKDDSFKGSIDNHDCRIPTRGKGDHDRCDYELYYLKQNDYWDSTNRIQLNRYAFCAAGSKTFLRRISCGS